MFSAIAVVPKREQQTGLELTLGALNLDISWSHRHTAPLLQSEICHVFEVHEVLRHQVNAPETGVGVRVEDMKELARLFDEITRERRDERREVPREQSQLPMMLCITCMGK
jgi:hypothetical protein